MPQKIKNVQVCIFHLCHLRTPASPHLHVSAHTPRTRVDTRTGPWCNPLGSWTNCRGSLLNNIRNIIINSLGDELTEYIFVEDDPALDRGLHKVMVDGRQSRVNHKWDEEEEQ